MNFPFHNNGFSVIAITITTAVFLLTAGGAYTYWSINQPLSFNDAVNDISGDPPDSLSSNSTFFTETNDAESVDSASPDDMTTTTDEFANSATSSVDIETDDDSDSVSTSFTTTSSLSVSNIQRQSIRRGVSGPVAEGISLKYEEFINQDSQRIIMQSDTTVCDPQDFIISPGEERAVLCGDEQYNLEFFDYDQENDMIAFSVKEGDSLSEDTDHSTISSENEEDKKVCDTDECIDEALAECQQAEYSGTMEAVGASVSYEILGRSESGTCRVELTYTENPNPEWVDKPLTCDYNTDLVMMNAVASALNSAASDNSANCTGPLYDVLQNL